MTDDVGNLVYLMILIVLVGSSLIAHRLPLGQMLKMAIAWLCIFAAIFIIFTYRVEFKSIFNRVRGELFAGTAVSQSGSVRVIKSPDGHFWIDAKVNGQTVRFMVDSGATTTSMAMESARISGVDMNNVDFPVIVSTANGAAEMQRGRIALLMIGSIERRDFPVLVSESLGDVNLLGMNFLSSLRGWRIEGDVLILTP